MPAESAIYCEVCRLPHRPGVVRCESCGHQLGTAPAWKALSAELPQLRLKILLGLAATAGMIALNVLLFGGAGYIVLVAPIAWTGSSIYRYRVLSTRLRARAQPENAT